MNENNASRRVEPAARGPRLDAVAGRVDAARSAALTALAERSGDERSWIDLRGVLGFIELSAGDPATAAAWLAPATDALVRRRDTHHTALHDAVHASVETGDLETAARLVAHLDGSAGPAAVHSRALLDAACGNLEAARTGAQAAASAQAVSDPFESARSLLLLGRIERRAKHWRVSRDALERAAARFAAHPAPLWRAKAEAELRRLGSRGPAGQLTETQRRVADLAASGLSNPEIAASIFVSRKTVEANLSTVYRTLGLRSRFELIARLTASGPPWIDPEPMAS